MKKYLLVLTLIVSVVFLTACGSSNELEGTWKGLTDGESRDNQIETTFVFKSGGEVEYSNEYGIKGNGTYEIKDDVVNIKLNTWDQAKDYKFKVDGDKLSLTATDVYSPSYSELKKQ